MQLRISEVMKQKNVSIEQLKNIIEENGSALSRTSISNIINNKSIPKIDTLILIAKALEVDFRDLVCVPETKKDTYHLINDNNVYTFNSIDELKEYINSL